MAEYQKMYTTLFNKITDAITLLQAAQTETEEMFLSQTKPEIVILNMPNKDEE